MSFRLVSFHKPSLQVIDQRQESKVGLAPTLLAAERVFQNCLSILGPRIDREVRLDSQVHAVLAEDLCAKCVEGSDVGASFEIGNEGSHACRHFVRSLVGERQGENVEALIPG